jgi:hypothetical protein
MGLQGAQGMQGAQGIQGTQGVQGPPGPAGVTHTWNGLLYPFVSVSGGKVAHFSISAPEAGFVTVIAHFATAVRNKFDSTLGDCAVYTELTTASNGSVSKTNGTSTLFVAGNLPTQQSVFTWQWFPQSVSRTFQVSAGTTNYFLNGVSEGGGCQGVLWGQINMTAFFSKQNASVSVIAN